MIQNKNITLSLYLMLVIAAVNVVCDVFFLPERNSGCLPGLRYYPTTSQLSLAYADASECKLLTETHLFAAGKRCK
jgi:hypothetical protein